MQNFLVVVVTILVAVFWAYKVFAAQPYYVTPPPPPIVVVPHEDEDNIGTGCRPGCKCEFDALGKPEIDCQDE